MQPTSVTSHPWTPCTSMHGTCKQGPIELSILDPFPPLENENEVRTFQAGAFRLLLPWMWFWRLSPCAFIVALAQLNLLALEFLLFA